MADNVSTMPFVWVYDDDVTIKGKKLRITYIADTSTTRLINRDYRVFN